MNKILFLVLLLCSYKVEAQQYNKDKSICLNMIVKNESHVITRCLESVLPIIDYWVIVDTGSDDNTIEVITDYMHRNNIPGEIYSRPWIDFGHNREEALQLAKDKCDYILYMDADDKLIYSSDFTLPDLSLDFYQITSDINGTHYNIPRLIKASLDWHWYGVMHECIYANNAYTNEILSGVTYLVVGGGGRSQDPNKYLKDAQILLEAIKKDPTNTRYMFYLAQSYSCAGDDENAIIYYKKRVEMGGWTEEVFWSLLQIAKCQERLGMDKQVIEDSYYLAHQYCPNRPEPIYYMVKNARVNGEHLKGYFLAKNGFNLPDLKDTLFLENWAYDGILFEFSICAWWIGQYEECLQACDTLLAKPNILDTFREYSLKNRQFAIDKINEQSGVF